VNWEYKKKFELSQNISAKILNVLGIKY